jgi:hypothetical protein
MNTVFTDTFVFMGPRFRGDDSGECIIPISHYALRASAPSIMSTVLPRP